MMIFILAIVVTAMLSIFFIVKFKLEWLRFFILLLLPPLLLAIYTGVINIRHFFEITGGFFLIGLFLMLPALLVFSIVVLLFEKKFSPNFFLLLVVSTMIGGLSTLPYFLSNSSLGNTALNSALITAPIATFLEKVFYRWRKK